MHFGANLVYAVPQEKKEKKQTHNQANCLYSHPHGAQCFLGMKLTHTQRQQVRGHMPLAAFF